MKTQDEQFIDWESAVFGFGYGTGENYTLKALKQFFDLLTDDRSYDYEMLEKAMTPTVAWLMINILARADIIEYGTSPRFGWLTEKGEKLSKYLQTKTVDALYEIVMRVEEGYYGCGDDYCNCGPTSVSKRCINNELF